MKRNHNPKHPYNIKNKLFTCFGIIIDNNHQTLKYTIMKRLLTILMIALIAVTTSCNKNSGNDPDTGPNMNNLVVPANFDWKTTQTIDVVVTLPDEGEIQPLLITNYDGTIKYFRGYPDDGSRTVKTKITIPTYVRDIRFIYNGTNGPNVAYIGSSTVEYNFNSNYKTTTDEDCGECDGQVTKLMLEYQGDVTSPSILVTGKKGGNEPVLYDEDNVTEPFEFVGANNDNKMGPEIKVYVNGILNVEIHTSCSVPILAGQVWGDFLIVSGESLNGGNLCSVEDPPSEDPYIEVSSECVSGDVVFTISNTGDGNMTSAYDYVVTKNDQAEASGTYDLDADETLELTYTGLTTDVYKIVVQTPRDEELEETITSCGSGGGGGGGGGDDLDGTLAYEDLWPGKGDYDFNDLVIDYEFSITKDNQENVESIEATFVIKAYGASLHNGFAFTLPTVEPDDIVSVTGYNIASSSVFNIDSKGLESGQSKATIVVFDDVRRVMPQTTGGIGVNTQEQYDFIDPVSMTITITFVEDAITYSELNIGSFNPFIIVNSVINGAPGIRGLEVHLPNYAPSDLMDDSYFDTLDDDSQPSLGKYFVTENNLPWAINIASDFDWVIEFQDITGAYLFFGAWAESGGTDYPDWYIDQTDYRNASKIYTVPSGK